ncbi:cadherin repeat domain-containing protein [Hydrogenimonas sp.]
MGESVSGCGMAAAGSGELTLYDVYPRTYPIKVTGVEGYEELDENLSDTITLSIGTPGASKVDRLTITDKYQYPNLGVGGHVADIVIFREDPKEPPVPLLVPLGRGGEFSSYRYSGGGGGGGSFWGGSSTKIPNAVLEPPLCSPAKSCGCLPCKYKILTYLSQARLGPIAGADVRLYRATDEGKAQRELLYEGKTTIGTSVDEAGIIRLPVPYPQQPESEYSDEQREFLSRIEGYEGDFILEVSGGYDIDANDDLVTDSNFKRFNGVLHLILSKERLMQNDYKVNILTEIGYQLCKDLLGEYYDSRLVQERLDDIASRILIEKLYPDANASIGRDDLMWWIPSAHKNWLVKSYDRYLEPIVMKLYEGEDIYSDAYEYVYAKPESISVPLLKSRWFRVDENLSGGSLVGTVEPVSEGESPIESYTLEGEGKELFRIDSDGKLYLEENATLDYELKQYYEFSIVAKNGAGESRPVTLYVIVNNIPDVPEFIKFEGGSVPEDASEGEVAGRVLFDPAGAPIDRIELEGKDASSFIVELNGTVRVSADTKLDYERSPAAHITVKAHNAYGYSRSRALSIVVVDKVDVPMVESVSANLPENAPAGTRVAEVQIKSEDPITDVVLEGSGSENFTIDNEGVIRVAEGASLDYEKRVNYSLNARASNVQGTSRPAPVRIRLQNMPDVPELKRSEYRVMEGAPAGTYVGDIALSSVDVSQVSEYRLLSGSDSFTVDSEGRIYTAIQMPSHDQREYFEIYVAAKNENGWGPKQIQVIYIDTHRPIIGKLSTWVYENASAGTEIGNIPVVRSSSAIERFEITGSGSENFKIDATGLVTVAPGATLDYESRSYYSLRVTAYNKSGASKSRSLYVRVVDRDDSLVIRGFSTRIHEDLAEGSTLGVVSVLRNGGIEVDRFVMEGDGKEHFIIDRSGLFKIQKGDFNDKVKNLYSFKVWAVGKDGSRSNEAEVNIAIDDALRGRPVLASFELEVEENTTVGSVLGKVSVVDEGSSPIEGYEISDNIGRIFSIDENGTIRLNSALDYERISSYDLMIRAYNRTSYSDVLHLPVKVVNVLDTPPRLVDYLEYIEIEENLPSGTVAGKVGIIDQGEAPIERFVLTGGGSEDFVVDLNGTIRVAEGATIDYESRRRYSLEATAYNSIGASNFAEVQISVLNVPEYPPELYDINETVRLDTPVSATIANILKSAGDTPIETIELSKKSPFAVDKSGSIYLERPLSEEECSYSFEAKARNGFGFSNPAKIEIEIEGRIDVEDLVLEVPFGLSSGETAANLKISEVCRQVESISLAGEGSGDFTIDSKGVIRVADGIALSFYRRQRYDLQVLINGGEHRAAVQIGVKRVIDSTPVLSVWVEKVLPAENGGRALLLKRAEGLRFAEIVDISDLIRPETVAAIELPLTSGDVTISSDGRTLAVSNGTTIELHNIEDPLRPIEKGRVEAESDEVVSLNITDGEKKLMAAFGSGVAVYSIAPDDFGAELGFKSISECSLQDGRFAMTESRLYLVCSNLWIQ